ncbi:hypothetical protein [Paenibacillus sp. Root444D2]|uniref:hypothetical protein n=1 Tax=Paenibacillus sp. Root444D2 TaxID=1736538 RepID=UPI00071251BB|nr:hypothetical protein [Paenibacillus sp. Root444D2]KQX69294.1 hypothetical protein ASD40_01985 [Paenibacillus sp. Root444D2]
MMFTAGGQVGGQDATIVWKDGMVSGSPFAVQLVLLEAANLEGELVGPVNQQTDTRHLSSPLSALMIIDRVLTAAVFTGEVPEVDSAPPGAVI